MFGKNADHSFLRVIGSRASIQEEGHRDKLDQRTWEGVLGPVLTMFRNSKSEKIKIKIGL